MTYTGGAPALSSSTGGAPAASSAGGGPGGAGSGGVAATNPSGGRPSSSGSGGVGIAGGNGGSATGAGVCDIFASGNSPCVAAHSTIRALFKAYAGNLYQVRRASDRTTKDIGALSAGGFADSATQDAFCVGTTCAISIIYDQSGKNNHLKQAPAGQRKATPDTEADASALKLTASGHTYTASTSPLGTAIEST
jgi:hypothetical protein